ncbi:glycosyltransferase [Rhodococcus qingshengii]|uniref:glycosyltransferase n=1 Tax=Rhodococcus qingshengii TaxID=334542 RepID=UPI00365A43A9
MSDKDDVLVLTTREKDWWWSMQEIFPAIERVWTSIGRCKPENVRVLCLPLLPEIKQYVETSTSTLKFVVLAAVTPQIVEIALLLRSRRQVDVPMIIYVHGDSTEGFEAFGELSSVLTEQDVFVVASESEANATRLCFPEAQIKVIPFPLVSQYKLNGENRDNRRKVVRLAYVGRIAEQKNLHTLLFALWILRNGRNPVPGITLDIFGGESSPGSPMMGLAYGNYSSYLRELAESLGVADAVTWHGMKSRDWLFYNVHMEPYIFVHPTLLSDENFGSSALASLANGHQVVSTEWGGPRDWREWFPGQLTLVPVRKSTKGPVVEPYSLADAILRSIESSATVVAENTSLNRARAEFSDSAVAARTYQLIDTLDGPAVSLTKSPVLRHLDERRAMFGGARKIYSDYGDTAAQAFFEAYGMDEPLIFEEGESYILAPWVSFSGQNLRIDDPHRGRQEFCIDTENSDTVEIMACPSMDEYHLPLYLVQELVVQGYAFPNPLAHS